MKCIDAGTSSSCAAVCQKCLKPITNIPLGALLIAVLPMENGYCLRRTHFTCAKIFLWGICFGEISMDTSKGIKELPMTAREVWCMD